MKQSEEELWVAFKANDAGAFKQIYEQYNRLLFSYCFKITTDEALIEDCIHDLFVDLWQHKATLGDTTSITYYLMSAVKRRLIRMMNKQKKYTVLENIPPDIDFELSYEALLIENEQLTHDKKQLFKHLDSLTKSQKEAVFLKYFADLSHQEVAEMMGINYQSVSNLLSNAIKRLRKYWLSWLLIVYSYFL